MQINETHAIEFITTQSKNLIQTAEYTLCGKYSKDRIQ
jgi:hypothetical protein